MSGEISIHYNIQLRGKVRKNVKGYSALPAKNGVSLNFEPGIVFTLYNHNDQSNIYFRITDDLKTSDLHKLLSGKRKVKKRAKKKQKT